MEAEIVWIPRLPIYSRFCIYASGCIFVKVLQVKPPYPPGILLPQAQAVITSLKLVFYLYKIQDLFRN